MKYPAVYALFFMSILCLSGKGQNKAVLPKDKIKSETKPVFTSYGPNSITRNIIQDRNGGIWMASWEGVFRYDGKSFANITSNETSARFFSLLEDKKGNLWLGSIGAGAYYYDGKSLQHFTTREGLVNNEVTCIYEDKAGNIWFGVNGGVSCYDGESFRNYMMDGNSMNEVSKGKTFPDFTRPPNEVNSIVEDKTGKFWFATRGNTFVYDGKTFTVFTNNGKPFANVRTLIEDKNGNIWLGGNDGLWRYDGRTFTNFTEKFVGYIIEDKKGNIWTSSESDNRQGWALSRYDGKSLYRSFFLNSSPVLKATVTEIAHKGMIFGIIEDDQGNIWFGADGVYRYDENTVTGFKGEKAQE